MTMGIITLIGLFIILSGIFWKKKNSWQARNPIGFVALVLTIVLLGVMLGPKLNNYLVPDFLEKWSYVDAYLDGPGGFNYVLFWVMMIILGFALVMVAKGLRPLLKYRFVAPTLLVLSGLAYFYFGSSIGMNLKAINVDLAKTAGEQMAPVGQQVMVSGLNTLGAFSNQLSRGLQSGQTIAPNHVIEEVKKQKVAQTQENGDFSTWQPWAMKNQESQSSVPNEYRAIPNDVDVPNRSSSLNKQTPGDESYNPADFEPALERPSSQDSRVNHESTAGFWNDVQKDAPQKQEKVKEKKKDERPRLYRFNNSKKNGPTP